MRLFDELVLGAKLIPVVCSSGCFNDIVPRRGTGRESLGFCLPSTDFQPCRHYTRVVFLLMRFYHIKRLSLAKKPNRVDFSGNCSTSSETTVMFLSRFCFARLIRPFNDHIESLFRSCEFGLTPFSLSRLSSAWLQSTRCLLIVSARVISLNVGPAMSASSSNTLILLVRLAAVLLDGPSGTVSLYIEPRVPSFPIESSRKRDCRSPAALISTDSARMRDCRTWFRPCDCSPRLGAVLGVLSLVPSTVPVLAGCAATARGAPGYLPAGFCSFDDDCRRILSSRAGWWCISVALILVTRLLSPLACSSAMAMRSLRQRSSASSVCGAIRRGFIATPCLPDPGTNRRLKLFPR